jgi:hypothetical protein
VVGFTTSSRGKVPGKACERRIKIIIIIIIIIIMFCNIFTIASKKNSREGLECMTMYLQPQHAKA